MTTRRNAITVAVLLSSAPGNRPVVTDRTDDIRAERWGVQAGSGMWYAEFSRQLAHEGVRIAGINLLSHQGRQIEIWTVKRDDALGRLAFWGEIISTSVRIGSSGEQQVYLARMMPYHFGHIDGPKFHLAGSPATKPLTIEFNPEVDGKIIDNMHEVGPDVYHIDPESTRTDEAKDYQTGTVGEWTVEKAFKWFIEHGNSSETHCDNPVASTFDSPPAVRNQILPWGQYLPFYLDAFLQRHGFNWTVDMRPDGEIWKPRIRVFKQQAGPARTILMQYGGQFDFEATNVSDLNFSVDIGTLSNHVTGYGARVEREITIELVRTWPESEDENFDHEDSKNAVGRKWAGNEAGDYIDVREEITAPAILSDAWNVRRRIAEDCITLRDGVRIPPVLEYQEEIGGEWKVVPEGWAYTLLPTEIGVWFTGEEASQGIPAELLIPETKLRLTCTVRGDTRLQYEVDQVGTSPNANECHTAIDLSDRFFDRKRQDTGTYASVQTVTDIDDADDQTAIEDYIDEISSKIKLADIQGTAKLIDLVFADYRVGDRISGVNGRSLSLSRSDGGTDYPQVSGIEWTNAVGGQYTTLTFSSDGVTRA